MTERLLAALAITLALALLTLYLWEIIDAWMTWVP